MTTCSAFYCQKLILISLILSVTILLSRCCRIVPKPVGKWSSTGGHHLVPTLCGSLTFMRTSIRAESVCSLSWSGECLVSMTHIPINNNPWLVLIQININALHYSVLHCFSEMRYIWAGYIWQCAFCVNVKVATLVRSWL